MHRASNRQAELDAQILRERRIGRRLLGAPETYTRLAERPGRALLGGAVASLVMAMVVAVVAVAGSARDARQGTGQARTAPPPTTPPAAATASSGASSGASQGAVPTAARTAATPAGQDPGRLVTEVSVGPAAVACQAGAVGIEVVALFTEEGVLGRVELAGIPPGCVGREVRLSVLGPDGAELASRVFVLEGAGSLSVGGWRQEEPLPREALGRIVVEIL